MSVESLKEQARNHEQREEWKPALDLYLQAIRRLDEDDQPDIGLYNRVADIEIRIGQVDRAADHYMNSVDLYTEAELPNNAIAVCKKIIRNIPARTDVYLKMGQIRASQGFLTDARQNFLFYAEQKQQEGDLEEAFRALVEFADLAPGDTEIRISLASQLHAHERTDEAVEQLIQARSRLILAERPDEVAGVEAMIEDMAPGTGLPHVDLIRAEAREANATTAFEPDALALEGVEAAFGSEDADESEADATPITPESEVVGLESTSLGEEVAPEDPEDPADEIAEAAGQTVAAEAAEQGLMAKADEDVADEGLAALAELAAAFEGVEEVLDDSVDDAGPAEATDNAHEILDDWAAEAGEEAADELPLMDFEDEAGNAGIEAPESVPDDDWLTKLTVDSRAPTGLEEEPTESFSPAALAVDMPATDVPAPETLLEQGLAAMGAGQPDDGVPLLKEAYGEFAKTGEFGQAMDALRALVAHEPDELEYHQRTVEYAFQVNDKTVLTQAYLDLAGCLERTGDPNKGRAVYQQVLGVDPENAAARAALGEATTIEPAATVEVASSEDYVDLGSLVFDEEEEEKTTRWFVEMADPTGDDEADFAKMLTQFKAKVSEHLEADDVRAHYDLGTAYREMGLVDEAIAEFQQALRGSSDHLPTYELLGQCFMEKGQYEVAVRSMNKALDVPHEVEDELLGIYYYLGRAHEELGNHEPAAEFYEKIFALDINFRDVTERLRALR